MLIFVYRRSYNTAGPADKYSHAPRISLEVRVLKSTLFSSSWFIDRWHLFCDSFLL